MSSAVLRTLVYPGVKSQEESMSPFHELLLRFTPVFGSADSDSVCETRQAEPRTVGGGILSGD